MTDGPTTTPTPATTTSATVVPAAVALASVTAGYGGKPVLHDVSLDVHPGEIVGVLGHNGAGKTTLLRTIFGLVAPSSGTVTVGADPARPRRISMVPAERIVFATLSVEHNLALAIPHDATAAAGERMAQAFEMFAILDRRRHQMAGSLSGGEQRMLALAMAIMRDPSVLLLDEPSIGLAPALVQAFLAQVVELTRQRRIACVLVEQNVRQTMRIADRIVVLREGRVVFSGTSIELGAVGEDQWWQLF